MSATDILSKAAQHMADRASTYDKPEGERSMGRAVEAFNAITGRDLSESEGWLLLQVLKSVRLFARPGYHADSAEDGVAYAALMAEAKSAEAIDHLEQVAGQAAELLEECQEHVRQFLASQNEAGDVQPKIDSGPMWVKSDGKGMPCEPGDVVEARLENGRIINARAEDLRWHRWDRPDDVAAWRHPWPEDDRIDAIGQNGATGEHY